MNLIYWEILQWVTDWINKVYTSQYTIDNTVELWIGWVPYVDFTVNWRIVTLGTAIPEWEDWPVLDYYFTDNVSPVTTSTYTVTNALNDVLINIGITQFNNAYKESRAIDLINECYYTELNKYRDNRLVSSFSFTSWDTYKYWTFYRWDIIPVQWTMSNYTPRVGKIMINWFITSFTTRTDTSFTLPDWLMTTPNNWDLVLVWYKVPTAIKEISYLTHNWIPYKRVSVEQFWIWNMSNTYTIKDWYLFLSYSASWQIVLQYTKINTQLTTWTDVIDIDNTYKLLLSLYASYNMMIHREDVRRAEIKQQYKELKSKYIAYLLRHSKRSNLLWTFNWPLNSL